VYREYRKSGRKNRTEAEYLQKEMIELKEDWKKKLVEAMVDEE
jgi:hypothetical protein